MESSQINPISEINKEFEARDAQKKAQKWGFPYIDIATFPINPDVLRGLNQEAIRQARVLPFFRNKKRLKIAVVNPVNRDTQNFIDTLKDLFEIEIHICSDYGLKKAYRVFEAEVLNKKTVEKNKKFDEDKKLDFAEELMAFEKLEKSIEAYPTEKALNEIEIFAIKTRASDIHIQPSEEGILLRFRIDGMLKDICKISYDTAYKLIARIKYESGMRSNIRDIPQDGHLDFEANGRKVDLRVSALPTETFESIVMRVLDSRKGILSFSELGFDEKIQKKIKRSINKKNGMVLVTGPTGSGKTTTLYAMLSDINIPEKKIVTLEDPIEYHLPNVTQSQVNEKKEYNFANGLRALLRHDPDVMLIGEIREVSVAKLATEASLTGHLVFSSLHTNSAVGAITRLRNLGIESYNIASSINAIFAQRLIRKTCTNCCTKKKIKAEFQTKLKDALDRVVHFYPELEKKIKKINDNNIEIETLVPNLDGCEKCTHTGFVGQIAISEAFEFTDLIREKISEGETESELLAHIKRTSDFLTLYEDGLRKVLEGKTSIDEVYRVAG